jgi:hypothetical protein
MIGSCSWCMHVELAGTKWNPLSKVFGTVPGGCNDCCVVCVSLEYIKDYEKQNKEKIRRSRGNQMDRMKHDRRKCVGRKDDTGTEAATWREYCNKGRTFPRAVRR